MNDTEYYVENLFDSLFVTSPHQLTIQNVTEKLKIRTFYWNYTSAIAEWRGKYGLFVNQKLSEQQQWQVFGHESLCQPFLGALITPVNPALYFCTLLRLPRDIRRLVSYSSGFVLQTKNQTG